MQMMTETAIDHKWLFTGLKAATFILFGLSVACTGKADESGSKKILPVVQDSARHFDTSKYKKPVFNGVDLYTGPYSTPKDMHGLTIVAYNYTDTYIDNFTVNGAGGGNVEVSTESGYGSGICCAPISADLQLPITVDIAWNRDSDTPWCKQTVLLQGPIPEKPNVFEVHFYQDGTIQVAITDYPSKPRFNLPRFNYAQRKATANVNNDSKFSICRS